MIRVYFLIHIFFLISCINDPTIVKEYIIEEDLPIEEIKDVEITQTENGKIRMKIFANNIDRFENISPNLILYNGIRCYFFNIDSTIQAKLNSETASIDEEKRIMKASNNVRLEGMNKRVLECDELFWNQDLNKVYTQKDVKIITDKEIIYGKGFSSNLDFTEYSIYKIRGVFNIDSDNNN